MVLELEVHAHTYTHAAIGKREDWINRKGKGKLNKISNIHRSKRQANSNDKLG